MTTLADIVIAKTTLGRESSGNNAETIQEAMGDCTKYVVRQEVLDIALEIMESTPRSEIPWPMSLLENVWIETTRRHLEGTMRTGLLLRTSGIGVAVFLAQERSYRIEAIIHDFEKQELAIVSQEALSRDDRQSVGWAIDLMLLILHMIQQPRIVERRLVAYDEKLQRKRARSGKHPLVYYHEITVHVTRRERAAAAAAQDVERRTGKRLHHVRAFYRVRCGRLERVCAHWRGDASLGVSVATGHRVSR